MKASIFRRIVSACAVTALLSGNALAAPYSGTGPFNTNAPSSGSSSIPIPVPVIDGGTGATSIGPTITNAGNILATTQPPDRTVTIATDTITASDVGKIILYNRSTSVAVAIASASSTGLTQGFGFTANNKGAGTVTITPTGSTINGASSLAIPQNTGCYIRSDGSNYLVDFASCSAIATLPTPTASTLGGVQSLTPTSHQWINTISTSGVPSSTQPAFSDISGTATLAQGGINSTNGNAYSLFGYPITTPLTYHAFGDSVTVGTAASPTSNGYVQLLAADSGTALTNRGSGGFTSCDITQAQIFQHENPGNTGNPMYTLMAGINDANTKGAGSYEAVYNTCQQAALSWLSIPSSFKVFGQNASCVQTGTWTNDTVYQTGIGVNSATNGSTLTCTITTTGGPIYAWYQLNDSSGGTFTYKLDSGSTTSLSTATTPAIAATGNTGIGLIRIPSVSAGSHTVTFAVTSATSGSNTVGIEGIGTVPNLAYWNGTKVYVGGVIRQKNDASAAATAAYDTDAKNNAALLLGDGLPVYFVDVRKYVNSTTDMDVAQAPLHPNNAGHEHLREAFGGVMQFTKSATPSGSPWVQNVPAEADQNQYIQTNGNGTVDCTNLNAGIAFYGAGTGSSFGADLGCLSGAYYTRLYGPQGKGVGIDTFGGTPTGQSSFYHNLFITDTGVPSVDYLQITGEPTGSPQNLPIAAKGTDTNIGIELSPKGTGYVDSRGGLVTKGTTYTISGCSATATAGGAQAGKFTSGTTGTCTVTITINGATGTSAPNGWSCWANDETTNADKMVETGSTNTTVTLSGTTASSDVIDFGCLGF